MIEKDKEIQARTKLLTTCLHSTISSWRLLVLNSQSDTTSDKQPSLMTAEEVMSKVDSFRPSYCTGCSDVQHDYRCKD